MAKKKKTAKSKTQEFNSNPFRDLKGFAVSEAEKNYPQPSEKNRPYAKVYGSFAEEMEMLGVRQLNPNDDPEEPTSEESLAPDTAPVEDADQTDEELFFSAVDGFSVRFEDHLPDESLPDTKAAPRRMKQLKQGKLTPDSSLDLHGCLRADVEKKLRHFLQDGQYQGWQTLLVVTGKGLHSEDGKSVLRDEAERFLSAAGRKLVVEWCRAPKRYGGDGALIVFLRKNRMAE